MKYGDTIRLYSGTTEQLIADTVKNQISEKMRNAFFHHFRHYPAASEISSWQNSLRAISLVFRESDLTDHGVILEQQLPLTSKRLDCLICGRDDARRDNATIIELKQWEQCKPAAGDNEVTTYVGGGNREVLHPSAQVGQYQMYLEDTHTAFYETDSPVRLQSCSYLHNYRQRSGDHLFDPKFAEVLRKYPLFTGDDVSQLMSYLRASLEAGEGLEVLRRIEDSKYRPSRKLMDHVGHLIKGKSEYVLLDEQLVVFDKVLSFAREGFHDRRKTVVIVKGGPGTGKSLIAINLMADLLLKGYNTQYATGSKAFTQTLKKVIGPKGAVQFKYFNSYLDAEYNSVDILICDEAHRIREYSHSMYTPKSKRTDIHQVQELIDASKVCVFFIDDKQVVRPREIGSVDLIREFAKKNDCAIFEYQLEAQFRCAGSDAFVNWINHTLEIERTANVLWDEDDAFDFQILDSPFALEEAIRAKAAEGNTARMAAGFCWPWSKKVKPDGTLVDDVVIRDFRRPWNARDDVSGLNINIPKSNYWAYDPKGIDQIGCIYTAQGFEFDYIGVIWGPDLVYRFGKGWIGQKEYSHDTVVKGSKDRFVDLVKNTYRVLLSRGLKGCFIHFMDKDTEKFVKTRIE
ncbi:MAG: DUF2075 domain-containing protein [Thermoplasmata archaeon]|nr:DUF2075 domain-containing protein [Thermoplasmata archaeon]